MDSATQEAIKQALELLAYIERFNGDGMFHGYDVRYIHNNLATTLTKEQS